MKKIFILLSIVLSTIIVLCLNQCRFGHKNIEADHYLEAVQLFADNVLNHGRDNYGKLKTPLFADGLQVDSLSPAIWKGQRGENWVLSNFANQQSLMRLLDGLSAITKEGKYSQAAEDAVHYALNNLRTPNGLLYWGGHASWDLNGDKAIKGAHELKNNEPYFRLMWSVDSASTRTLMENIWFAHVINWYHIDYNRHASCKKVYPPNWDHEFTSDIEVPFPADTLNLSFCNVTPPLMHSGLSLAVLGKNEKALTWTRRLCYRWQQARDSRTGLSGGQLSYHSNKIDRAQKALGHVHPNINEAKIVASYHQSSRYHTLPLSQMQEAELLIDAGGKFADLGNELIEWASSDLKTYTEQCYDPAAGVFIARMTDGTPIQWQQSKEGYYNPESFTSVKPDGKILWSYAMAYRLTEDKSHWEMVRSICKNIGLGDPGNPGNAKNGLNLETSTTNWHILYALLEMYESTHDKEILKLACKIADNLLEWQISNGLFPRPGRDYARTSDEVPLAILHLAATIKGMHNLLPNPILDNAFFHAVYHGELEPNQEKRRDRRTYDQRVFYGPK